MTVYQIDQGNIQFMKLTAFDCSFLKTIEGNDKIFLSKNGRYHCLELDNKKVGVVGYIPLDKVSGFVQIAIVSEFRGRGLVKKAYDLLVVKYRLKRLLATIEIDNLASIKSHLKSGFVMLGDREIERLRKGGVLDSNKIRMIKKYIQGINSTT